MPASSESSLSLPSPIARGVGLAGVVLIVLFLTILSASLMPVRVLDPAWQLRVGGVLINASPFPLIGLVLFHIAAGLDPRDRRLANRRRFAAQVAVAVAIGYLLLAPLLATANLQRQQRQALASSGELSRATERLNEMRQVANSASSIPELEQGMAAVQGPSLDAADRTLPLPVLRSRIASLLDQASAQLERARSSAPRASPWVLVGDIVCASVACLALAAGFAGLARRPGSELSLLQEWQRGWDHWQWRLRQRGSSRGAGTDEDDYIRELSAKQDLSPDELELVKRLISELRAKKE
jgi:hypothetical protein